MQNKLFEARWKAYKEALLEGDDLKFGFDRKTPQPTKAACLGLLLENAKNDMLNNPTMMLFENAAAASTSAGNIATLNRVLLPVIRRVMPTVIANEIIGVQPMPGPVCQIHTLRVKYAQTFPVVGAPGFPGVIAGDEALGPFFIARYYSGNGNPTNPAAAPTATLEGTVGQRISIQIVKETVTAGTRRLSATWTFEAAQDAQSQHAIDLEAEIMSAMAQEITAEIDQEILFSLRRLPGAPTSIFDQSLVTGTPTYIGDVHAALAILINNQANLIASRTRRGAGNWVVVSPTALTILQSATTSAFARTTEGVFEAPTNTKFVGVLNNQMRVYVDQYAREDTPVLIGFKGSEIDAAAYFCPYVPLTATGVVIDPATYQPSIGLMTRYGYLELSDINNSLGNAADYLGLVGINASSLTFL